MTTPYVSDPPAALLIPVTLGCDYIFTVELQDMSANPVNYPGDVYCYVTNRGAAAVQLVATVAGNLADVRIPPGVADTVSATSSWRVVMQDTSYDPPAEIPLLTGSFERHD